MNKVIAGDVVVCVRTSFVLEEPKLERHVEDAVSRAVGDALYELFGPGKRSVMVLVRGDHEEGGL